MNKEELVTKVIDEIKKDAQIGGILHSDKWADTAYRIVKLLDLHIVSKRLILENLRERMQDVYPEYYLSIIDDEIEGLNGC